MTKSIDYYALAMPRHLRLRGNEQSRIEALTLEEVLLFQQGEKEKALKIEEELLSSAKASNNLQLQFLCDLVIAEILDGTERTDRVQSALKEAESLVGSDVKVPGVQPSLIVELYFRLACLHEMRKDARQELIALEKAITPAVALSSAPGETKNDKPLAWLVPKLEATITQNHIRDISGEGICRWELCRCTRLF